jgi:hypothetical protein
LDCYTAGLQLTRQWTLFGFSAISMRISIQFKQTGWMNAAAQDGNSNTRSAKIQAFVASMGCGENFG